MRSLLSPPLSNLPERPFDALVEEAAEALPALPDQVLLVLDIDGTIRHPDGPTPRILDALNRAQRAGIHTVIATGRGVASTKPVVAEMGLEAGWTVCSNGALTLQWDPDPRITAQHLFDPRPAAEAVLAAFPDALLGADEGPDGLVVSAPFPAGELMYEVSAASLDEVIGTPTSKLVVRIPGMSRESFADAMYGLDLGDVELAIGWTSWADIGPAGVTKASALADLAQELGVPPEGTIAIGDGMNDISMLQWAAHGVAMGSAPREVVEHANATTGSVENDGAAAVIEAILAR